MGNRIAIGVILFILGYVYGSEPRPMAESALIISIVSFVLGAGAFRLFTSVRRNAREQILKLLKADKQPQGVDPAPEQSVRLVAVKSTTSFDCDFCQGEKEIRIAGSKEIMPCPKCKRNKKETG